MVMCCSVAKARRERMATCFGPALLKEVPTLDYPLDRISEGIARVGGPRNSRTTCSGPVRRNLESSKARTSVRDR